MRRRSATRSTGSGHRRSWCSRSLVPALIESLLRGPVGDGVEGRVLVHPGVAVVAGVDAAAGVREVDEVCQLLRGLDVGTAFAGEHQDVVLIEGEALPIRVAWVGVPVSMTEPEPAATAATEEIDAAGAGRIGELRIADSDFAQYALHLVDRAGGDGDLGNVALALVLRHHGDGSGQGGVGAGRCAGTARTAGAIGRR